jgi:nitrite reductase (NADH) small subunit
MALRRRVCRLDEIAAGELRGFRIDGVTWPVIATVIDGAPVAFPGVCPHDDVSLADYGVLVDDAVVCRVHGYRFDVNSGRCEHAPALQLRRYRTTVVGDELWVDLL